MKKYLSDYNDDLPPNLNTISSIQSQYASPKTQLHDDIYKTSSSFILTNDYNNNYKNIHENLKSSPVPNNYINNEIKSQEKNINFLRKNNDLLISSVVQTPMNFYNNHLKSPDNINLIRENNDFLIHSEVQTSRNFYNNHLKSPEKNANLINENNELFASPKTFSGVKRKYQFDSKLEENISSAKQQSDEALNILINV